MGWKAFSKGKVNSYCDFAPQDEDPSKRGSRKWSFAGRTNSSTSGIRMFSTFTKTWCPDGLNKTNCVCIVDVGAARNLGEATMSNILLSFMPASSMIDYFSNDREREKVIAKDFATSVGLTLQSAEAAPTEIESWCKRLDDFVVKIGGKNDVNRRRSLTLVMTYSNSKTLGSKSSASSRRSSTKQVGKMKSSATMSATMRRSIKTHKDDILSPLTQFVLSSSEVGAPLIEVMSYVWSRGKREAGLQDISATETESGHRKLTTNHQMTWAKRGEGVFALLYVPREGKPEDGDAWLVRLTEVTGSGSGSGSGSTGRTKLERFIINRTEKSGQENGVVVHNFRDHFTKMKKLDEMDERDGVVVGERLGSGKEELVSVLKEYDGFGTLMRSQPWFVEMMDAILLNSLKTGKDVACGVHELTAFDGQTIGRSFSSSLATTLTGEAAVDEWACCFRAVKEVRDEERSEEWEMRQSFRIYN